MDPVKLPARRDPAENAVDAYEAEYMRPDSPALRQRTGVPGRLFIGLSAVLTALAVLSASWKLAIVGTVLAVWLLFAVLRVQVEADALVVHFGWIRRRIPLASITSAVTTRYSLAEGGGALWLRKTARGLLFAVPGAGGRAVAVSFTDEAGAARTWILASREPEELCAMIASGRRGVLGSGASDRALEDAAAQRGLAAVSDGGAEAGVAPEGNDRHRVDG